jgi:hypothetical protein
MKRPKVGEEREYVLSKGDVLTLTATEESRIKVRGKLGLIVVEVEDLPTSNRKKAAELVAEAEKLEAERRIDTNRPT